MGVSDGNAMQRACIDVAENDNMEAFAYSSMILQVMRAMTPCLSSHDVSDVVLLVRAQVLPTYAHLP